VTISKPAHGAADWDTQTNQVIDEVNAHETLLNLDAWHGPDSGDTVQHVGVPLYIYPDWFGSPPRVWDKLNDNAPGVRYVIVNPDTGPGASLNTDYQYQIQLAQASGVKVLGYVSTHYASVLLATILSDATKWVDWYAIDGIFLDETSYASNHAHYLSAYEGIKAIDDNLLVVANPGLGVDASMVDTADIFVSFEGTPTDYRLRPDVAAPAWERLAPAYRQWHLIHSVASLTEAQEMLDLARTYRAGTVFVTDRTMPNPWLGLPIISGIWEAQLARTRPADRSTDVTPETFGAVGDGSANDTTALTNAIAALSTGDTLYIAAGKIYTHTTVLTLTADGVTLAGPGEIRATAEATSAFQITGDNVTIRDVKFSCPTLTTRGSTLSHHKVVLDGADGTRLLRVKVDGSKAAGIFAYGASNYLIQDCIVENTLADGIHNTKGSTFGRIFDCSTDTTGDDGISVVSYDSGGSAGLCSDIIIRGGHVKGVSGGRGISVVGGQRIEYHDCTVDGTYGAGIIVACEGASVTDSTDDVLFRNITVRDANTVGSGQPDHGGLLLTNDRASHHIDDVRFENITLTDTRSAATRSISLLSANGGTADGIVLDNIQVRGTAPTTLFGSDYAAAHYSTWQVSAGRLDGWELLNSFTFPGGTATSGALTVGARDELMIVCRILSLGSADIPALRFNADTANNYQSRYVTCATGGTTLTNTATTSTSMARLSGLSSNLTRVITATVNNHKDWQKAGIVDSRLSTGSAASTPDMDLSGGFEWTNTTAQITSVTLLTAGGANVGGNTQIMIFGRNAGL
jgi:hypothetical protein